MPTRSMFLMRRSQSNISGTGVMNGAPSRWMARRPPVTALSVYLGRPCFSSSFSHSLLSMWVCTSMTGLMSVHLCAGGLDDGRPTADIVFDDVPELLGRIGRPGFHAEFLQ